MKMAFWEGYVSDETMGTFGPIVVYWLYAGLHQLLNPLPILDNYRLHTKIEENKKNYVPLSTVVKGVLFQQLVQATMAQTLFLLTRDTNKTIPKQPSIPIQLLQIILAMLIIDTWQYFIHRYMHENKFLYRHVHSRHHKLIVPYAIGALYNHPLENFAVDVGAAISFILTGMTARTAVVYFCFGMIKTVDDHCGLWLPGNILQLVFHNNAAYHDIHHQIPCLKYNYSQFFTIWDRLQGTYMPYSLVKRPEGGFEVRPCKKEQTIVTK